jgi:hypothetical protein
MTQKRRSRHCEPEAKRRAKQSRPARCRSYVTQRDGLVEGLIGPNADSQPSGRDRVGSRGSRTSGDSPPSGRTISRSRSPLSARLTWIAGVWIAGTGSLADTAGRTSAPRDGPSGTSSTKATHSAATTAPAVSMKDREGRRIALLRTQRDTGALLSLVARVRKKVHPPDPRASQSTLLVRASSP